MSLQRLQKGDQVIVIAGKDKGKKGKVMRLFKETDRVVVEGVNLVKRHVRATSESGGGIQQKPAPIAISNVMPIDPQTGKATRVRFETKDGTKTRVAKSGAVITSAES